MKSSVLILILLWAAVTPEAVPQNGALPEDHLRPEQVAQYLRFLASDELRGRETGDIGAEVAARYLAEHFRAAGLDTLPGAPDFLQRIPFERVTAPTHGHLIVPGDTLHLGEDFLVVNRQNGKVRAAAVYVGHDLGGEDSVLHTNRLENIRGKVVVAEFGTSESSSAMAGFRAMPKKREAARSSGAAALIELYHGNFPWERIRRFSSSARLQLAGEEEANVPFLHLLLHDPDSTWQQRFAQSQRAAIMMQAEGASRKRLTSSNVVGAVKGADPILREEFVLLSAHYDHVGVTSSATGDSIHNGARDNGMGTVALMAAAQALAQTPPARSVIFLATTGEELGLFGSNYYVEHPLAPLQRTVFVLNNDGAGYNDTSAVTIFGLERTSVEKTVRQACAAFGLRVVLDPIPQENIFRRSDNINFARQGIPAPTFSPGIVRWDEHISSKYHQVSDEADESFDFEYLLKYCQAYSRSARAIANLPAAPKWQAGDEFEAVAKTLYGK